MEGLLRSLGFSSEIPAPLGPCSTVGVVPFRFPDSVFCKIFYPAVETEGHSLSGDVKNLVKELYGYNVNKRGPFKYTRKDVVKGMSKWTKTPKAVFHYTMGYNAVPFKFFLPPKSEKTVQGISSNVEIEKVPQCKYPVIIFSHGLGGNADIYSKFCLDMASHGYIVFALEHEDGSGSFACDISNNKIFYSGPPAGMKYERGTVVKFRKPFIEKRKQEIFSVINFLHDFKTSPEKLCANFKIFPAVEKELFSLCDTENLFMAGHSFGGTTTLSVLHDIENNEKNKLTSNTFKGAILLDLWPFPADEKLEKDGVKVPLFSVVGEDFFGYDEFEITRRILRSSNTQMSCYIKGVTHTQFSDGPWFTKLKFMKRRGLLEGKISGEISQASIVNAVSKFLTNPGSFSDQGYNDNRLIPINHRQKES